MQHIVTDGEACSVCLSVGWSVTILSPAKTAEPIEMPFAVWTWVDPRNHVLDDGPDPPSEGAILRGNIICMANGWLEEQDQHFFLQKNLSWTKCISVAGTTPWAIKRSQLIFVCNFVPSKINAFQCGFQC